jgi:hypothetical protein
MTAEGWLNPEHISCDFFVWLETHCGIGSLRGRIDLFIGECSLENLSDSRTKQVYSAGKCPCKCIIITI